MDDVISLGVGEPDFDTPWHIRDEGIYSLKKAVPITLQTQVFWNSARRSANMYRINIMFPMIQKQRFL